jgi:hypothetical protein
MKRVFALLLVLAACQKVSDALSEPPQTLKSPDGTLQVTVPGDWSTKEKLNEQAVLQISKPGKELYAIVLTEPKSDVPGMTLEKFSDATRTRQLEVMKNSSEEGPKKRTVNGLPAIEYVLKGEANGSAIVMKHVAVEGTKRFHQILVWTLQSKWDKEQAGLDAVIDSLKET